MPTAAQDRQRQQRRGGRVRTPLTYYGGKQKLAREIVSFMPPHYTYLEPFCGGAAVLFAKPRAERETLNDLDGAVMRFWRALRDEPERLAEVVAATPYGRTEWQQARDLDVDDDVEAARRLLINVDQSYARTRKSWSPPAQLRDRKGRWQPATWSTMPERIQTAAHRLRGVCLECEDALTLLPRWDLPGTVIYVDPPYPMETRNRRRMGNWRSYHHEVTAEMWGDLVDVLGGIRRAMVLVSGYACDEMDQLGWQEIELTALLASSARAGGTLAPAPERLWLSPQCVAGADQLSFLSAANGAMCP
jgi:DNA adenine methylase